MAYDVCGNRDEMPEVQDYLENTSCTRSQFDTNVLQVLLENSNTKPYLFSGFPGPGRGGHEYYVLYFITNTSIIVQELHEQVSGQLLCVLYRQELKDYFCTQLTL